MLGDWSWLNKVLVEGPDAEALLEYASVRSIASQSPGRSRFTPMVAENGKLAIEGLTMRLADEEFLFTQSGALQWLRQVQARSGLERVKLTDVTPDFTCFASRDHGHTTCSRRSWVRTGATSRSPTSLDAPVRHGRHDRPPRGDRGAWLRTLHAHRNRSGP